MNFNRVAVYRTAHFNAAHRLHNPKWSDEKNKQIFGLCNNANYHGHNYELEVKLIGEIDPETGYVFDMKVLGNLINEHIEKRFDHKNLNIDCPEFQAIIPSAENIVVVIWQILRGVIDTRFDLHVKLYETPRNYVSFPA